MKQLHMRFLDKRISFLSEAHSRGLFSRDKIRNTLKIGKTCCFVLWKSCKNDPHSFPLSYDRTSPNRISPKAAAAIEHELIREGVPIQPPDIPIRTYDDSDL